MALCIPKKHEKDKNIPELEKQLLCLVQFIFIFLFLNLSKLKLIISKQKQANSLYKNGKNKFNILYLIVRKCVMSFSTDYKVQVKHLTLHLEFKCTVRVAWEVEIATKNNLNICFLIPYLPEIR